MVRRLVAAIALFGGMLGPAAASASAPPTPVLSAASHQDLRAFADAMNEPSLDHADVFSPGSPAHTFYTGGALLRTYGDPTLYTSDSEYRVLPDGLVDDVLGHQFFDVLADEEGRIADAVRNRIPLSASVYSSGVEHEAGGLHATIHSVRYLNSVLQVVTVVENNSDEDAFVYVRSVVVDGEEYPNTYVAIAKPGETVARLDVFADVPDTGGTAHALIVIGETNAPGGEFEFEIPAMGSPQPAA